MCSQKRTNPAIRPIPPKTPIAIPALAPPVSPFEADAAAEVVAEAVEDENWSTAVPVVEVEDADCVEEDVTKVVEGSLEVVNKSDNEVAELVDVVDVLVISGALVVVDDVSAFEVVLVLVDWATGAPFPAVVVGSAVVVSAPVT